MRRFLFLLLLVASFSLYAKGNDLEKSFEKATKYFKAGEPKRAITLYKAAFELAGPGIQKEIIAYNLGASYLEDGQFDEAIRKFEGIFEKKERLPEYLIEKSSYNLMLSYIKKSEEILDKEEELIEKDDFSRVKEMLKKASEMYSYFSSITDEKEDEQLKRDLWLSLKGLNSKYQVQVNLLALDEITLEGGIEQLRDRVYSQVYRFEKLSEKEMSPSMSKYFLGKDYISEKKSLPFWDRVEKVIEMKIYELQLQSSDEGSYKLEELQSFLNGFQESYNEYVSSLECMRENRLWQGRLRGAKAMLQLDLLDIYLKKEDAIEYCLNQRVLLQKKQNSSPHNSPLFNSLHKEIKMHSTAAASFIDGSLKEMKKKEESFDKSLITSLGDVLKSNLKVGANFLYDCYIYEEIKKKPEEILYPIYTSLANPSKMGLKAQEQYLYQLKAASKRFDLQKKLDYEEPQKKKISVAYDKILTAFHSYCAKDYASSFLNLEDFLLSWNFRSFMQGKIGDFRKKYGALLHEKVEAKALQTLTSDVNYLEQLQKRAELSKEEELLAEYLERGFEEIKSSVDLHSNVKEKPLKKLLFENGYQWTARMSRVLRIEPQNSAALLKEGIEEQKHALQFSEAYQKNILSYEKLLSIAKDCECHPIKAVEFFEKAFNKEQASAKDEEKGREDILLFKKGLKEAHAAQRLLGKENVSWKTVVIKQKNVIEHWEKILEQSQEDNKDSSQSGSDGQGQNSESKKESSNISQSPESSESDGEEPFPQSDQKIMGILERLHEMQQDDKIGKKNHKNTKKGLRPW